MKKLIFFLYFLFLAGFMIFSYVFIDQNLFYFKRFYTGFYSINRQLTTAVYISLVLLFFTFYGFFIWMNLKKMISSFDMKLLVLITSITMFFSYSAMLSFDIFNYLTTAKVIFSYHENPYIIMPIEFIGDTNLLFTHAANKIALYGPFWIGLSGIPYFLGFGNFLISLFNFKLFITAFYLGTLWLIKKITKNNYSVILFALNPLVIIETLVGSHNDIVMMFLALFSFFFLMRKKILLASIFLALSILVKYATIFLLPIFILTAIKIIKKQKVNWDKVFLYSTISMFFIFLLSTLREEIYPWYAIWFLVFSFLIPQKRLLLYLSFAFSFGLLFRHVPFMLLGTHFGPTPLIKGFVTFFPAFLVLFYGYFKKIYR